MLLAALPWRDSHPVTAAQVLKQLHKAPDDSPEVKNQKARLALRDFIGYMVSIFPH